MKRKENSFTLDLQTLGTQLWSGLCLSAPPRRQRGHDCLGSPRRPCQQLPVKSSLSTKHDGAQNLSNLLLTATREGRGSGRETRITEWSWFWNPELRLHLNISALQHLYLQISKSKLHLLIILHRVVNKVVCVLPVIHTATHADGRGKETFCKRSLSKWFARIVSTSGADCPTASCPEIADSLWVLWAARVLAEKFTDSF